MASLIDIFNPSFFMFLGILVLVVALLVVYFESKMREQNHKMASMLNLITCIADEMNSIKIHLSNHVTNNLFGGIAPTFQPSNLETNDIHIIKTDLIPVSDDSESESDNHSENSIEDDESDNGSESSSGSNLEDIDEDKNIIEIGDNSDIKVLKLNISNINDIDDIDDIDENKDITDLENLEDDDDDDISLGGISLTSNSDEYKNEPEYKDENDADNKNEELDISKLNLKTINISSLEEVKNSTNIDYKKFTLNKLRSIVVEKELVADSSKLKKNELLKLLGAE